MGGILAASGEVDEAVERLGEALRLFEGAGDLSGVGAICSRLAKVLEEVGRDEEALDHAQRCLDVARETGSQYLVWSALMVMAGVAEQRDLTEAERLYRAAMDSIANPLARRVMTVQTQIALGQLLARKGDLDGAKRELQEAVQTTGDSPVLGLVEAGGHEALAEVHEGLGELSLTVHHLRKAQDLRERIARREASNKLAQVEARAAVEAAKKDAEIHKLRFVELHGMQAKLLEAEKMALLGKLAAGTAHELNTPLGVLRSNAELIARATERLLGLLGEDTDLGARTQKLAATLASCRATSDEAVERLAAVAQSFSRFTLLDQAERRPLDICEALESALALLEPTIPDEIAIERRFSTVPPVEGWPRKLNFAFLTVLQNAVQAIDGAGKVVVETAVEEQQVTVRVRDTGRGMSEEQVVHLFDVGWAEGERTSMRLGLSAAYTTVQRHGGTLEVQSVPGQETTVTFRLPVG